MKSGRFLQLEYQDFAMEEDQQQISKQSLEFQSKIYVLSTNQTSYAADLSIHGDEISVQTEPIFVSESATC